MDAVSSVSLHSFFFHFFQQTVEAVYRNFFPRNYFVNETLREAAQLHTRPRMKIFISDRSFDSHGL